MSKLDGLKRSADAGDSRAQVLIGRACLYGRGVAIDYKQAGIYFSRAAQSDDINASLDAKVGLAILKAGGKGVDKDQRAAYLTIEWAAREKNTWAIISLALSHYQLGTAEAFARALTLMDQAIDDLNGETEMRAEAAETVARWYAGDKTKGIERDEDKQCQYFLKAAKMGGGSAVVAHAMQALGERYEWGNDLPVDFTKANEMYKLARKNGSPAASFYSAKLASSTKEGSEKKYHSAWDLPDLEKLDTSTLGAEEIFNIACAVDLCGEKDEALKLFKRVKQASDFAQLSPYIKEDLQLIEYFRSLKMDDYFEVLASSAVLTRFEKRILKVYLPIGESGYSRREKELIWQALNAWLDALDKGLSLTSVEDENNCDLCFLPVKKDIFYGTAVARTCYGDNDGKRLLDCAGRTVIQLPKSDLASVDEETNCIHTYLHEIGHALGLRGHSIFSSDVMFGLQSHITDLSPRDVSAIKTLYSNGAEGKIENILLDQAAGKNPFALSRLGLYHQANWRDEEALTALEEASALGNAKAQLLLGLLYWRRLDFQKAADLFDQAAAAGLVQASVYRNFLTGHPGNNGSVVSKESLEALHKAAATGDGQAMISLGLIYAFGDQTHEPDLPKAYSFFKRASEQGSASATLLLSMTNVVSASQFVWNRVFKQP